jgi:hypothetical protein
MAAANGSFHPLFETFGVSPLGVKSRPSGFEAHSCGDLMPEKATMSAAQWLERLRIKRKHL